MKNIKTFEPVSTSSNTEDFSLRGIKMFVCHPFTMKIVVFMDEPSNFDSSIRLFRCRIKFAITISSCSGSTLSF